MNFGKRKQTEHLELMNKPYGVSAAHPLATDVGMEILEKGGNAVDAAIAISFALGVVEPYGSGIGGGGVMMIAHGDEVPIFYDYRECAPWKGTPTKLKIGIPGFVKGMEQIHQDLATLDWSTLIQPAVRLAKQGFPAHRVLVRQLEVSNHLDGNMLKHFYNNETPKELGEPILQLELAETLSEIAKNGSEVFYHGKIGEAICQHIPDIHPDDLSRYEVKKRDVLKGSYDDYKIYSAPAPLAGNMLIQSLQMSEMLCLEQYDIYDTAFIDQLARILRSCYAERREHNGDPDFLDFDQQRFTSKSYCQEMLHSSYFKKDSEPNLSLNIHDYNNTTAFVVTDANGMLISTTNTLSDLFGSGVNVKGFFLNNQMRNFSDKTYLKNTYQAGKRPHSFIAPTILSHNDKKIVIGSSGGKRIPNMLTRILIQHIKKGVSLQQASNALRYFIDEKHIFLEERLSPTVEQHLQQYNYSIQHDPNPIFYGGVHALATVHEKIEGSADKRRGGKYKIHQGI